MEIKTVDMEIPEGSNVILGQSHFIKTVEDIHETISEAVPGAKFGLAFCEASGPHLVRKSGTDSEMVEKAVKAAQDIGAGHSFVIYTKNFFPVNVLNRIKSVSEVCNVFCATANPLQVIVAETEKGRGILGVIDGGSPKGVETEQDIKGRKALLRKIGYKVI
ncbi:MAG: adenosine-specific kinase [archaeon]|nr:MAG: adenosine-specific kinase [archaeon]